MTPLWATLKGMAVAIVAGFVLGRLFGAGGIAAAIALGAWSSALSLIRHGAASFGFSIDPMSAAAAAAHRAGGARDGRRCCGWRRISCWPLAATRTASRRPSSCWS